MNEKNIDIEKIEAIFENMLTMMDSSKKDIFLISETSRKRHEEMKQELEIVRRKTLEKIERRDEIDRLTQLSRRKLADISKGFNTFTEEELKACYDEANDLVLQSSVVVMQEKQLRKQRDDLERRLVELLETIERADQLVNQVSTVLTYLQSDLKNVGKALKSAKMRQELQVQIIHAQEEERKRLSREIHDGPAQLLANVSLRMGFLGRHVDEKKDQQFIHELEELKRMTKDTLEEVRRIIFDLRPMALDDLGLTPTVKKYLERTKDYHPSVEFHFSSKGIFRRLHSNIESSSFRLIQESVSNALKHAEPKDIFVNIEWLHDTMNIVIRDNGKGFVAEEVQSKSFGLLGMKERVELLKGTFKIESKMNKGTTVFFTIPLTEEAK